MKLAFQAFAFSLVFSSPALATLDCHLQTSRSGDAPAVCAYFAGIGSAPYRNWYDDNGIEAKYSSRVYLQGSDPNHPENGAAVHWKVEGKYVYLAVAARATGWLGFGIAEVVGMLGADMAIFEAARPQQIVDAHTSDIRLPIADDCPSDWELLTSDVDEGGGFIMIEFKRLLDTKDPQDKVIFCASALIPPTRGVAAWATTGSIVLEERFDSLAPVMTRQHLTKL